MPELTGDLKGEGCDGPQSVKDISKCFSGVRCLMLRESFEAGEIWESVKHY